MGKIHGMSKSRFYGIWNDMMMRCYNPNRERFSRYGGRGIIVCKRWRTFNNFFLDMFPSYKVGLSLERRKVNRNYCKSNCCWIPKHKQCLNRENTIRLTIDGIVKSVQEWAAISGINDRTIYLRKSNGWPDKDCVFKPLDKQPLSKDKIREAKQLYKEGCSMREVARRVGTYHSAIKKYIT